jgi:hypothetical protein
MVVMYDAPPTAVAASLMTLLSLPPMKALL